MIALHFYFDIFLRRVQSRKKHMAVVIVPLGFNHFQTNGITIKLHTFTIKPGWPIAYIEGSQAIISKKYRISILS